MERSWKIACCWQVSRGVLCGASRKIAGRWQVLRGCFCGATWKVAGGWQCYAPKEHIQKITPYKIPKTLRTFSLPEFSCSRQLFAGCFCRIATTKQRLVQKYHTSFSKIVLAADIPTNPPPTTIACSDRDEDIATKMTSKQGSESWRAVFREAIECIDQMV